MPASSIIRHTIHLVALVTLLLFGSLAHALTLSIEMNPNPVRPNEVLTAQLTVANNTGSAVSGVVLQATVPANVNSLNVAVATPTATCIQNNNVGSCDPTELVNWNLGTIPAGGGVTVSLPLTVVAAATAGTTITLPGNVLVNGSSTVTANASAVVSTSNALSLSVDEDKNPVAPGSQLTYTLTYANRAASTSVTSTTLSFPLPAGTTFVSATGGGVFSAGSVQWTLGTLPATQSGQQQVVVSVNNGTSAGTVLVVDAAVLSGTSLVAETASATAMTRVAVSPPLALAIEMNPDPVRPNELLTAQLTVTNRGSTALTGVMLQARMPLGVTSIAVQVLSGGGTCIQANNSGACDSTELVNWNLGTIAAGKGITISMPVVVTSTTTAGRLITLEALTTDDSSNKAVAEDTAAVDSDNPLSLAVDEDKNPVVAGGALTYTLTYANRAATSSITNTTLSFPIPAGTTFVSATGGGTFSNGSVQWNIGSLPATQSDHQQVVVSVDGALTGGTILAVNVAEVSGLNSSLVVESARATAITRTTASPPLTLAVELNPDPVRPTELLTAQLTVTNRGGTALTGVVLQGRMPLGVDSIAIQVVSGGGTCIQANNSGACDSTELVNWNLGTIPAGSGVTVSLPVVVTSTTTAGRLITLEALATDDGSNKAVTEQTVAVDSDNPLSLAVDEDKNPVATGGNLTYTLTYANRATTSSITGTMLSFPIPAGTSFVSASGGGTFSNGSVQWNIGSLPATQSDQQQVLVSVDGATAAGTALAVNTALLTGLNSSLVAESARATAITRVAASPPLVLAIELNPDPARPTEQLLAELTVSNRGNTPLTGVVLQARLPQGVNSIVPAAQTLGGTCIQANNSGACDFTELANWNLGTIPAGTGVTVSMPMVVSAATDAGQLITQEVLATDDGLNKAVAQQTVAVDTDNPLSLAVNDDRDAVPGGVLVYTLTYGNRAATGNVTNATLRFPLPAEAVLIGSTGGTVVDGDIVWNLGSLPAGSGGRRKVTLSVPGTVTAGSVLRVDAAQLKGNIVAGQVPDATRATAATRVEASKALGLTAVFAPDPVMATQALTGTLTVTNTSGGTLTGVVLQARVPQSINSFNPAVLTGGGTCIQLNNSGACDFTELANWNVGTMLAGATVTVSMPMVVTTGTVNGRLISVETLVRDDSGKLSTQEKTVLLGPFTDTDGDGVADLFDNCINIANPDQRDTDGDGYGNRCDADLDNSGFVNITDLGILKARFGTSNADADLDGNGFVNITDVGIFKSLFGKAPGPSGLRP